MFVKILQKLKAQAKKLKSEVEVLAIAYTDKRTPMMAKILVGITVAYLLSPIDLIPDFIPVLGILDDLIIVPLLITASLKLIPAIVIAEARDVVQKNPPKLNKNNWLFAVVIVGIWAIALYLSYKFVRGLWESD
jgi:uncharacterized membrane protein YkvA (DUF1232 family)